MSKRPDTWMPMYWGDYAKDTGHLNALGHGAYLMLLKHYWCSGGPLADDDDELWRVACCDSKKEWLKLRPKISRFFDARDGLLIHRRVEEEMAKSAALTEARAKAGKSGGQRKWGESKPDHGKTRSQRLAAARAQATHTEEEWLAMVDLFNGRCARCGDASGRVCKDHIVPIYQGGSDGIENIQPLCRSCNSSKGPDVTDHRGNVYQNWRERLAKRLANGVAKCQPVA